MENAFMAPGGGGKPKPAAAYPVVVSALYAGSDISGSLSGGTGTWTNLDPDSLYLIRTHIMSGTYTCEGGEILTYTASDGGSRNGFAIIRTSGSTFKLIGSGGSAYSMVATKLGV